MAVKNKTTWTNVPVAEFLEASVDQEQKKADSYQLLELMEKWSGFKPEMWGPSIIGFGRYHYKYASGHEGDAPILGFSPRKAAITLYIFSPTPKSQDLLETLGKYKITKGCIYIKKLSDIHLPSLKKLCEESITYIQAHHECGCRE